MVYQVLDLSSVRVIIIMIIASTQRDEVQICRMFFAMSQVSFCTFRGQWTMDMLRTTMNNSHITLFKCSATIEDQTQRDWGHRNYFIFFYCWLFSHSSLNGSYASEHKRNKGNTSSFAGQQKFFIRNCHPCNWGDNSKSSRVNGLWKYLLLMFKNLWSYIYFYQFIGWFITFQIAIYETHEKWNDPQYASDVNINN